MERVAFLVERTGARLGCLLNPESLVVRRQAGVRPRRSPGGPLAGADQRDDPLLYTGGGVTLLELDLVFDVALAESSIKTDDVRQLTAPLWELAENSKEEGGYGRPPLVYFVWGKSWNVPGVVTAVAERLEYFTPEGTPRRSWLRLRLRRVSEALADTTPTLPPSFLLDLQEPGAAQPAPEGTFLHEVIGGGAEDPEEPEGGASGERLDEIAYRSYGDVASWRLLATLNNLADPLRLAAGQVLQVPQRALKEGAQ